MADIPIHIIGMNVQIEPSLYPGESYPVLAVRINLPAGKEFNLRYQLRHDDLETHFDAIWRYVGERIKEQFKTPGFVEKRANERWPEEPIYPGMLKRYENP